CNYYTYGKTKDSATMANVLNVIVVFVVPDIGNVSLYLYYGLYAIYSCTMVTDDSASPPFYVCDHICPCRPL
ncbi:MAG TPA: hypothetical protein VFJ51_12930, partial [Nitrososphaeraceae archaeon]|nr:hypothetical protein [Nitrososphaeraceae archaeon]